MDRVERTGLGDFNIRPEGNNIQVRLHFPDASTQTPILLTLTREEFGRLATALHDVQTIEDIPTPPNHRPAAGKPSLRVVRNDPES